MCLAVVGCRWVHIRTIIIRIREKGSFASGSAQLDIAFLAVLDKTGLALNEINGSIFIEGHTDTDPISVTKDKYKSNRDLSMRRADAVAMYLIKQGVPESSIVTVGYGEYDPIAPGNKASNRRVEIVVGDML